MNCKTERKQDENQVLCGGKNKWITKNTSTLEEISEIMSAVSLGHLDAPCILYNHKGYYDDLKALLAKMIEEGLSSEERQKGIYFADSIQQIVEILG